VSPQQRSRFPDGRTLGIGQLRIPPGDTRSPEFNPPSERAVDLLETRGAEGTVITYPPHGKPLNAVTIFDFEVYRGE
jgi:hypothetical protein